MRPRRKAWLCIAAIATVGALPIGTAVSANAVSGYHTSANSVRIRADASTQTSQIGLIGAAGTPIDIGCQIGGETVTAAGFGTSSVWDAVSGGFISDLFVRETPYAQFDSRIPRCGSAPTPQPPPAPQPSPTYVTNAVATIRSAPSFNATPVGTLPINTAISIACQNNGTKVSGSFIWDKVGNGFVSDVQVNGTPFGVFDNQLPRCGLGYQPVDCDHTLYIGARGSGEEPGSLGMGKDSDPVMATYKKLDGMRPGTVDPGGVDYYANLVDLLISGPKYIAIYLAGVHDGTAKTLAVLRRRTDGNVCGWEHTKSVIVGYSQGAWAVGDAIEQMTPEERRTIRAVVTYGNPRYNSGANGASGSSGVGVKGPRNAYPDGVDARSRDYCRQDIVCKRGSLNKAEHGRYVNPGPEADRGAAFLASTI